MRALRVTNTQVTSFSSRKSHAHLNKVDRPLPPADVNFGAEDTLLFTSRNGLLDPPSACSAPRNLATGDSRSYI